MQYHVPTERVPDDGVLAGEIDWLIADCRIPLLRYAANLAGDPDAAMDAMQEATLRYWMARKSGAEFDNPRAWMFRVARHYLLDQIRRRARQRPVDLSMATRIADPKENPEQAYQQSDLAERIGSALSPRERVCVRHRIDGLSYEDIGRSMGISTNTVGVLLNRASKKIQAAC